MSLKPARPESSYRLDVSFMTKEDLRDATYDLKQWPDVLHWFSSSGTTGLPVVYPWTRRDEECALRTLARIYTPQEHSPGSTAFIIAPTGLPSMWAHMDRQLKFLRYATVFPGPDSPKRILALIPSLKPRLLISLPLALTRLGDLWRFSVTDHLCHPDILFTGGDVLSEARRTRLAALWQAEVRNFYGLSEIFGPLAAENEQLGIQSWQATEVEVEILDPLTLQPVPEGAVGVAVLTTLWDRPVKLVRYWTGDLFKLVNWIEPGRPRFIVKGRQGISLPGLRAGIHPVDIDEILLSDPALGTEWMVEVRSDAVVITCEAPHPREMVSSLTIQQLQDSFASHVSLQVVVPGFLDRSRQKLGLPEWG